MYFFVNTAVFPKNYAEICENKYFDEIAKNKDRHQFEA